MKSFFRKAWPIAAVTALAVILALQIPRKALFFKPVAETAQVPFASFVTYDAATYAEVLQKSRPSWQLRGAVGSAYESHVDAFDFEEDVPPLEQVPLPDDFVRMPVQNDFQFRPASLQPPALVGSSAPKPLAMAPNDNVETMRSRAELLELPESLQMKE